MHAVRLWESTSERRELINVVVEVLFPEAAPEACTPETRLRKNSWASCWSCTAILSAPLRHLDTDNGTRTTDKRESRGGSGGFPPFCLATARCKPGGLSKTTTAA